MEVAQSAVFTVSSFAAWLCRQGGKHKDLPFGLAGKHDVDIGRPSDDFAVREA